MPPPRLVHTASTLRARRYEYAIRAGSRAELSFGDRRRRVGGSVPLASGRLRLDLEDLTTVRASLVFDLAAIELLPSDSPVTSPPAAETLTEQSLNWLQLRAGANPSARPEHRFARFESMTVGWTSHSAAEAGDRVRPAPPAASARRVRMRVDGELELHGYRLPYTVHMAATFAWDAPARAGAPPSSIELTTTEPVGIDLLAHGVVPRNTRGDVRADRLAELRRLSDHPVQITARWLAELVAR